jgi:hypothetical protein
MCDEITSGYSKRNCRAIAGVKSFIPVDMSNIDTYTTDGAGTVTALTSHRTCFRYSLDVNSSSYTQTPTGDRANGAYNIVQAFTAIFKDDELATDQAMDLFVQGYYAIIVEMRNGKVKLLGAENGLTVTTIEMTSGQAGTDLTGSTISMEGDENTVAPVIADAAIITALLVAHS